MPPAESQSPKRGPRTAPKAEEAEEQGSLAEIKAHLAAFLEERLYSGAESRAPSGKAQGPSPPPPNSIPLKSLLEQPRIGARGHLALPVFRLPRPPGESPQSLAKAFEEKIASSPGLPHFLKSARAAGGFVNFIFAEDFLGSRLQRQLSKKKLGFFEGASPKKRYVMDFASPNVAKHINVGHLRAAAQGQALVNLARRFGCHVTALNHLGDWGSQFGKLLWAWKAWGHEYDFEKEPFESLTALYTRFYREAESDPEKLKEAVSLFQKLEAGDPELKKLWRRFADLSLEDYGRYWKILNIRHDKVIGESFYTEFLSGLKSRLREKGLLKKSDGAEVVFLESGPPCLVAKSDGASTYGARDLCSAIYRFEKLEADQLIYIAGSDQKLHFKQIFEVLEKLSPSWKGRSLHLSFGMYRFKGRGKMSSRRGQAVYLKELLNQAVERVEKIISSRREASDQANPAERTNPAERASPAERANPADQASPAEQANPAEQASPADQANPSEPANPADQANPAEQKTEAQSKRKIAEQVGIGALIFNDLMNDRIKDVDFDWDRILDFEGRSGPFVQYSHVRCLSLLKKSGKTPEQLRQGLMSEGFSRLREGDELDLAWRLLCFEDALSQSFKALKPHILARYLLDLAACFNRFYGAGKILGTERERELLLLVDGARRALEEGLQILNIPRPQAM